MPTAIANTVTLSKPTAVSQTAKAPTATGISSLMAADGFSRRQAVPLHFGAQEHYGPRNRSVKVITDYNDGTSNNEVIDRVERALAFTVNHDRQLEQGLIPRAKAFFTRLLHWVLNQPRELFGYALEAWTNEPRGKRYLPIHSIPDIDFGDASFGSLTLVRLAASEKNQNIFIHVVDPGVGFNGAQHHDRTIMITKEHGIHIGPNNGSLGLLYRRLQEEGDQPLLYQIDFDKVQKLERLRKGNPDYVIPTIIHGRDVFGVLAGYIAGGFKPENFVVTDENGQPKVLEPTFNDFVDPAPLPGKSGEPVSVNALRDKTFANIKLNLPLSKQAFDEFRAAHPVLQVRHEGQTDWIDVPVKTCFSDVGLNQWVSYLGSSDGIYPGTQNLELALNRGLAGQALKIEPGRLAKLQIRLKQDAGF